MACLNCSTTGIGRIGPNVIFDSPRSPLEKLTSQPVSVAWSDWDSCYFSLNGMLLHRSGNPNRMSPVGNFYSRVEIGGVGLKCLVQRASVQTPTCFFEFRRTNRFNPLFLSPPLLLLMISNRVEISCGLTPTSSILLKNSHFYDCIHTVFKKSISGVCLLEMSA